MRCTEKGLNLQLIDLIGIGMYNMYLFMCICLLCVSLGLSLLFEYSAFIICFFLLCSLCVCVFLLFPLFISSLSVGIILYGITRTLALSFHIVY